MSFYVKTTWKWFLAKVPPPPLRLLFQYDEISTMMMMVDSPIGVRDSRPLYLVLHFASDDNKSESYLKNGNCSVRLVESGPPPAIGATIILLERPRIGAPRRVHVETVWSTRVPQGGRRLIFQNSRVAAVGKRKTATTTATTITTTAKDGQRRGGGRKRVNDWTTWSWE